MLGIDITSLEAIILSQKWVSKKEQMLTLARQHVHIPQQIFDQILFFNSIKADGHYSYESENFF